MSLKFANLQQYIFLEKKCRNISQFSVEWSEFCYGLDKRKLVEWGANLKYFIWFEEESCVFVTFFFKSNTKIANQTARKQVLIHLSSAIRIIIRHPCPSPLWTWPCPPCPCLCRCICCPSLLSLVERLLLLPHLFFLSFADRSTPLHYCNTKHVAEAEQVSLVSD